ncbi:glycosyl transferase family 2 [Chitinophaga skermanii]|uniref:Glycosyl transferase family 2 n=1 Tax=Chitinophaga skermanii TaxID=331697 RepID=A0A327R3A5_9BACT|nr:glycosyltransferase [Chitinophaga skermanii]RAJ11200.1 glycosyl transferase family 2 [Chitinophaga skermanii]
MIDFSIVICAYNPEQRILQRCLQAVQHLDVYGLETDIFLVDNNSTTPLLSLPYIQAFLQAMPNMQVLEVKEQGVFHARIAAIEAAQGKHIVYIDADNEPAENYLQALKQLTIAYPQVGAWGPGNVYVDFLDGVPSNIKYTARAAFQERHETEPRYASIAAWQDCYPFGTGLCTQTPILKKYVALAKAGALTLPGRTGKALSSGEDTQMVLLCIREGYAAGVAPILHITHLIPGSRANKGYLKRLIYGTFLCYELSLLQIFPEEITRLQNTVLSPRQFSTLARRQFIRNLFQTAPSKTFAFVQFLAVQAGIYTALGMPLPSTVQRIIRWLKLEK